jgi:hypothetical protein
MDGMCLCCHFLHQSDDPRRSVTLVGEADRRMLKAAIKHGSGEDKIRHRIVPSEAVSKWSEKLNEMKDEMKEILQEEKEEKHARHQYFCLQIMY